MHIWRGVGVGIALAALAAGSATASTPELSVSQRLADRREVAAGTRAQVLGFEDGRFYAQGWAVSLPTSSGTSATRVSPSRVSLVTAILTSAT